MDWQCFPVKKRDNRLFQAAREGQTKKCEDLLIGGANVNVRDALGKNLSAVTRWQMIREWVVLTGAGP